jgi:hypothetical protein
VGQEAQVGERPTRFPRWLTGLFLLAASGLAWMTSRSISVSLPASRLERSWWLGLTVAFALAGTWELCGLENWVGAEARTLARAEDVYYPRALFQKAVISLTFAATVVCLGRIWRKRKSYQPALWFFGLYLAISIVNLLSLHSIDNYAGLSWHGITLIGAFKLLCAAATLLSVFRARQ